MDYHRQNAVDTRIVRIFNTDGERMLENDAPLCPILSFRRFAAEELTIMATAARRVRFVTSAILLMVIRSDEHRSGRLFTYTVNIGNRANLRMNELRPR